MESLARLTTTRFRPARSSAEVEGTIEAALDLESGEAISNPFASSAEAVSLLRLRAKQLRAA